MFTEPMDLLQEIDEKFSAKFAELTEKATALGAERESAESAEDRQKVIDQITQVEDAVKELTDARNEELAVAEKAAMSSRIESLEEAIKSAADERPSFSLGPVRETGQKAIYGAGSEHSFFVDAKAAIEKSGSEQLERWQEALGEKAMTSGQGTTGGYLVPPEISSQIIALREQSNVLRGLFSAVSVNSDTYRLAAQTSGLLAGWVAELAEKPLSELSFGEISVNTFTKAGMAVVSNQLLRDSNPSIDRLIYSDLGKRLAALEEIAFISGTGTGQPLGILNTPGVGTTEVTSTDVDDLLDGIVDAITSIYTDYFGAPNGILMHPLTWARIIKARKADATSEYQVGPPKSRTADDALPGFGSAANPTGRLFGFPVYTTRNVPVTFGDTDNQAPIVVGNFSEGLILDHAGVTLDSSEHVFFTTNQTIFRAEDQVGFTAARYPKAFNVIHGDGLVV